MKDAYCYECKHMCYDILGNARCLFKTNKEGHTLIVRQYGIACDNFEGKEV